jgi:glutathione S-transferase
MTANSLPQSDPLSPVEQEENVFAQGSQMVSSGTGPSEPRPHGQLVGRIVVDPPDLQAWRQKLFNIDDMIVLTNEQYVMATLTGSQA